MKASIRSATAADAAAIAEIYRPAVTDNATSFELTAPDAAEMARRIAATQQRYPWIVLQDTDVLGYAYASEFRKRPAYVWSTEVSVYVADSAKRRGVATALYTSLLELLRLQGYHQAIAGVTLPNPASVEFHEGLGFKPIGAFLNVGFKFGEWHDVGFWSLQLTEASSTPDPPKQLSADTERQRALALGLTHYNGR